MSTFNLEKNGIFGEFMVPWGQGSDPSFHITVSTSSFVQEQTKGDRVDKKNPTAHQFLEKNDIPSFFGF